MESRPNLKESPYRGVSLTPKGWFWYVTGSTVEMGTTKTAVEAALMFNEAIRRDLGDIGIGYSDMMNMVTPEAIQETAVQVADDTGPWNARRKARWERLERRWRMFGVRPAPAVSIAELEAVEEPDRPLCRCGQEPAGKNGRLGKNCDAAAAQARRERKRAQ